MKGNFPHCTKQNCIVIGCCIGLVIAAIFLGPGLQIQQKKNLDLKIAESRERAQVLKRAGELRQQLQERINRLQTTTGPHPVKRKALPSDQADQVLDELHRLADHAGIELVVVRPKLESMGQDSKSMQIAATVQGNMAGFQNMLDSLLQVPYVEGLQRMLVSVEAAGLQLEIDFSVHLQ